MPPRDRWDRLCLVVTSLIAGSGGIARVAHLMAKVLSEEARRGSFDVRTISLLDERGRSDVGVPISASGGSRWRFVSTVYAAAARNTHFLYDSLAMVRAHNRLPLLRRPLLAWVHGVEVWEHAKPSRLECARRAHFLVANSRYTRERAERLHGGFARARVCWLGTEGDEPAAADRPADGPPTVLILGRLELGREKGHSALIDCWPTVTAAVPGARLVIVGMGPDLERVRQQAASSRAATAIDLMGFVPDREIEAVWSRATVFAMPSRGEGFGLTYVEAMRHGVPVIASVHDAAPEINLDGQSGYNVDLDRPGELADRLIGVLRDRDLGAQLGRNGRRRWEEHFCFSAFRARFLSVLEEFLTLY